MDDLWTCPDCGRSFATRNQAHSCLTTSLDEHLEGASPRAVLLYEAVDEALRACGEFRVHPQQTRVAFIVRMTFASVRLARRWIDLSLITPAPINDERIGRVDLFGPTSFANELRLHSPEDVDTDVRQWICIAHRRGLQETLDSTAAVDPVTGLTLERLRVPLASTVVAVSPPTGEETGLGLSVPRYAVDAFAAHPLVVARMAGTEISGEIIERGGAGVVVAGIASLGLGEGDQVDITLSADL